MKELPIIKRLRKTIQDQITQYVDEALDGESGFFTDADMICTDADCLGDFLMYLIDGDLPLGCAETNLRKPEMPAEKSRLANKLVRDILREKRKQDRQNRESDVQ